MPASSEASAVGCPRCGAEPDARCAGIDLGYHSARVERWQAEQRERVATGKAPEPERLRVRAFLARLRADHGWSER